jgi:hypothetical protein
VCWTITASFGSVQIVDSNNASPGDSFTNSGTSNTGQAVGSSGWYYNNVRNNGTAGINTTYARSGNGSLYLDGTQGDPTSSKADIEFLPNATVNGDGNYSPGGALGLLSDLTALSYDWYRDSSSAAASHLHPSLRLQLVSTDFMKSGYIVFERIYNGFTGAAPTNSWQSDDVFGQNYTMWSTGTLPGAFTDYSRTLSQWISGISGQYYVIGVSSGFGSGWDPFTGAVDNITFGFGGNDTTYNFEVPTAAVPEPMSVAVWSFLGVCGIAFARKFASKVVPA